MISCQKAACFKMAPMAVRSQCRPVTCNKQMLHCFNLKSKPVCGLFLANCCQSSPFI